MGFDDARHVGLFLQAEGVLDRKQHQRARVCRENRPRHQRFVRRSADDEDLSAILAERTVEPGALMFAGTPLLIAIGFLYLTDLDAPVDVMAVPPALRVGMSWVVLVARAWSEYWSARWKWPSCCSNSSTRMPRMPLAASTSRNPWGMVREILAEDHRLMPPGLQAEQAQHVVEGKLRYTPRLGSAPAGTTHRRLRPSTWSMRMPPAWARLARSIYIGPEAMLTQAPGRERGDAPVLSVAVHHVRRCADAQRSEQFALAAPGLAATAVGADGKVGDQTDACQLRAATRAR